MSARPARGRGPNAVARQTDVVGGGALHVDISRRGGGWAHAPRAGLRDALFRQLARGRQGLAKSLELTERYCVVNQTLRGNAQLSVALATDKRRERPQTTRSPTGSTSARRE